MARIAARDHHRADALVTAGDLLPKRASHRNTDWVLRRARPRDVAAVKTLFWKLHAFNAALDPRFALAEDWEACVDAALEGAVRGRDALCLVAYERGNRQPCGFSLAAVHRDSDMWRYREWVEVEDLYVEDAWRGCGLAICLLDRTCAWANRVGQSVAQLYVTASNERALQFYRREGFQHTQAILRKVLS